MSPIILGPKAVPVGVTSTDNAVFTNTDFSTATGYATLHGPLSLAVDIDNKYYTPIYISVTIELYNRTTYIADRVHIGFAGPLKHINISGASVPQLAHIDGEITKITITSYRFPDLIVTNGTGFIVTLFIDAPFIVSAPQPIIGQDSTVYEPYIHAGIFSDGFPCPAATNGTVITEVRTIPVNNQYRYKIKTLTLGAYPTPFPGDLRVYASIDRQFEYGASLADIRPAVIFSEVGGMVVEVIPVDIILNTGDRIQIRGDNVNSTNSYNGIGYIYGETIF